MANPTLPFAEPQLFLCGGVSRTSTPQSLRTEEITHLATSGPRASIRLQVDQLTTILQSTLPELLTDLLEVAAYVYIADQSCSRGVVSGFDYGARWRRDLRLVIPVRRPEVWSRPEVQSELTAALRFLSDDNWRFHFLLHPDPIQPKRYLTDGLVSVPETRASGDWEEVQLFSGGLDSLGGAIDEIFHGQRRTILVSHRPTNPMFARQRDLVAAIAKRLPHPTYRPLHVAVTVNHRDREAVDTTQRTRSFLFAAVAAITARVLGRDRIRFYENGVTSLNLPISAELIGAQASRTTHPQSLHRLANFFSALFECPFDIQNPYQWRTKADVLQRLRTEGHADLCALTSSCVHTRELNEGYTHCGRCSQCVDRRLAAIAAGLSRTDDDPARYRSDVILGERTGAELTLVERYTGFAGDMALLTAPDQFLQAFPQVNSALRYLDGDPAGNLQQIYELHQRHAATLQTTLRTVVAEQAEAITRQSFPAHSLLGVVVGRVQPTIMSTSLTSPTANGSQNGSQSSLPYRWVVDLERFEVRWGAQPAVFLGNTREFHLVRYLSQHQRAYLSIDQLLERVWSDNRVAPGTVRRTISNLRRRLTTGFPGVTIDGKQRGCYRLIVPDQPPTSHISTPVSRSE